MEQRDDLVKFCKVLTYWLFSMFVSKSSVHAVAYGLTGFRVQWLCMPWHDILSKTQAKPRHLVDFEKTLGRLYLTVLDFSLLQGVTGRRSLVAVLYT